MNNVSEIEKITRRTVLERDKYQCFLCKRGNVQVHEIIPRSRFGKLQQDKLFDVKNRVCLCPSCHSKAHSIQSRKLLIKAMREAYKYDYQEQHFKDYL